MATFVTAKQGNITHHINLDLVTHLETLPNGSTHVHFASEKKLHVDTPAIELLTGARKFG